MVERALPVAGHVERNPHVRRRNAVEHDTANRRLVLLQIHERRARAVRTAPEVDLAVSEELPNIVDVVHRNRRGVEPNVRLQLSETGAEALDRVVIDAAKVVVSGRVGGAVQRIRFSRAPLVDEDNVAVGLVLAEHRDTLGGERRRATTRATLEDEQRIGFGNSAEGWSDDDLQVDGASATGDPVLEDAVRPAPRVGRALRNRAGMQMVQRSLAGTLACRSEQQREEDERGAHPASLSDGTAHDWRGYRRSPNHSAGASTYDRPRALVPATPSSVNVRTRSARRISIARATPGPPAAPSPYA